jgi:hypothetical protein
MLALAANSRYYKPVLQRALPRARPVQLPVAAPQPAPVRPVVYEDEGEDDMWGYNPKPYLLDARPPAKEPVHILPSAGLNANNCKVNPWLLMAMLNHPGTPEEMMTFSALTVKGKTWDDKDKSTSTYPGKSLGLDFVMRSLEGCRDNQKARDVFAINYLMQDKPELYNVLYDPTEADTDEKRGWKKYELNGNHGPLVPMLGLSGKPFKDWTDSKVLINMYKWKIYNSLYSGTPMTAVKRFKEKYDLFKTERRDADAHVVAQHAEFEKNKRVDLNQKWIGSAALSEHPLTAVQSLEGIKTKQKMDDIPHWMPYIPSFLNRRG